ncbi:MAG: hypothetical protein VX181_17420, partial [Pseudomonadota bacterium]|nr:hypothetical protein [Pseudomonadota bacterium]
MAFGMIFSSFFSTLGQLDDPRFRRVLGLGIVLSILLLILAYVGFLWFLQAILGESSTLPLVGEVTWINDLATWTSLLLMIVLSVFLMIPVASA